MLETKNLSTTEKLLLIIDNNKITHENFTNTSFKILLEELLIHLYGDIGYCYDNSAITKIGSGGYVKINANCINTIHRNTVLINFENLYSQITYEIISNFNFNYTNFPTVYKFMYETYNLFKGATLNENMNTRTILKKWLIYFYGNINNNIIFSDSDIQNIVAIKAQAILKDIHEKFSKDVFYCDSDHFFFKFNPKLMEYLKNIKYAYDINYIDNIIFIAMKKYIIYDDSMKITKIKGIKSY